MMGMLASYLSVSGVLVDELVLGEAVGLVLGHALGHKVGDPLGLLRRLGGRVGHGGLVVALGGILPAHGTAAGVGQVELAAVVVVELLDRLGGLHLLDQAHLGEVGLAPLLHCRV